MVNSKASQEFSNTCMQGYLFNISQLKTLVDDYLSFMKQIDPKSVDDDTQQGATTFKNFLDKYIEVCPDYQGVPLHTANTPVQRADLRNLQDTPHKPIAAKTGISHST